MARTALRICLMQWETECFRRVRFKHAGLRCVLFLNGSAGSALISSPEKEPGPEGVQKHCIHRAQGLCFP